MFFHPFLACLLSSLTDKERMKQQQRSQLHSALFSSHLSSTGADENSLFKKTTKIKKAKIKIKMK
jgi:hypothetical protein